MSDAVLGITIGADTKDLEKGVSVVTGNLTQLDKIVSQVSKQGFFKGSKDVTAYQRALNDVNKSLKVQQTTLRDLTQQQKALQHALAEQAQKGIAATDEQTQAYERLGKQIKLVDDAMSKGANQRNRLMSTANRAPSGMFAQERAALGGYLGRFTPMGVASMGYSWIKGQADAGKAILMANQQARMGTEGLTGMPAYNFRGVERYGRRLGYTTAQIHDISQATMQATDRWSPGDVRSNIAMMRGYNMDQGTVLGFQSAVRHAGGNPAAGVLNDVLVTARRASHVSRLIMGEFTQALSGIVTDIGGARKELKTKETIGFVAALSRGMGPAYQQSPQRTAALVSALHSTIQTPGGGEAGQSFMMRALGLGQKGVGYMDVRRRMQEGFTPANVRAMLAQSTAEYGNNMNNRVLALSSLTGGKLKDHQIEDLLKLYDKGALTDEKLKLATGQTDIEGEAAKRKGRMALQARDIAKGEAQGQVRSELDPAYSLVEKAVMKILRDIASALRSIKKILSGDWKAGLKEILLQMWGNSPPGMLIDWIRGKNKKQGKKGRQEK